MTTSSSSRPQSAARAPGLLTHLPLADKPPLLQTFGLLLCLGLLGFTGLQVYYALLDYFTYPTVLSVSNGETAAFPDLVFCSNVPFSYSSGVSGLTKFNEAMTKFQLAYNAIINALPVSAMNHSVSSLLTNVSTSVSSVSSLLSNVSTSVGNVSSLLTDASSLLTNVSSLLTNASSLLPNASSLLTNISTSVSNLNVSSLLTNVSSLLTDVSGSIGNVSSILSNISANPALSLSPNYAFLQAAVHSLGRLLFKQSFGIWEETLIFSCRLDDGTDCNVRSRFEQVDSAPYLNCYRFLPDSNVTGVTFILFSESLIGSSDFETKFNGAFPLSAVTMSGDAEYDRSAGVALFVKHKDFFLHEDFKVMASTGQSSLLTYTENVYNSIASVGSPCIDNPGTVTYLVYAQATNASAQYEPQWQVFTATKTDCVLRAQMDFLQFRCSCRDPMMPIDQQRSIIPNCLNVSSPTYSATSVCYSAVKKQIDKVSTQHCYSPCSKRYYTVKLSGTKWPLETNLQAVVQTLVARRQAAVNATYGKVLAGLAYITGLNDLIGQNSSVPADSVNCTRLSLLSKLSGVIGSNFVKLEVRPDSDKVQKSEESLKYNVLTLVGNIGGIVGLFLGWSFLSFVDLLQLFYELALFTRLRMAASSKGTWARRSSKTQAVSPGDV